MLEHATLMLRPLDAASAQAIVDPETGAPLGSARPRAAGLLERWLAGPVVEVREHEDGSLLCVIRGGLLRPHRRLVHDADGRPVGAVRGRRLEGRDGRVVAVRRHGAETGGAVFVDAEGRPLAALRPAAAGAELAYTDAIAADPFTKMLVLAAALHA
jgi:hypothetical protein